MNSWWYSKAETKISGKLFLSTYTIHVFFFPPLADWKYFAHAKEKRKKVDSRAKAIKGSKRSRVSWFYCCIALCRSHKLTYCMLNNSMTSSTMNFFFPNIIYLFTGYVFLAERAENNSCYCDTRAAVAMLNNRICQIEISFPIFSLFFFFPLALTYDSRPSVTAETAAMYRDARNCIKNH